MFLNLCRNEGNSQAFDLVTDNQHTSSQQMSMHQHQQRHQQQEQQQQQQQQQQKINYCTICNKELCNKYFMKTHMLKMHGIKLELDKASDADGSDHETSGQQHKLWAPGGATSDGWPHAGPHQQANGPQSSSNQPPVASVMGGVVCDICNKELCSKYFLKVHKQNTHGIVTDYQDQLSGAHQFMYGPLSSPNPFLAPSLLGLFLGGGGAHMPPAVPVSGGPSALGQQPVSNQPLNLSNQEQPESQRSPAMPAGESYFPRCHEDEHDEDRDHEQERDELVGGPTKRARYSPPTSNGQLEATYRLLLAQQQQQQQAAGAGNPMGALWCLGGALGLGAGLSPAMVVDSMLRNQQMLNRQRGPQCGGAIAASVKVEQPSGRQDHRSAGGKALVVGAKELAKKETTGSGNNSRYFSHYTEACPMCDRRFKSIKWLKTHMLNDHKQEIGAYMQMMMQYLCNSKSQQLAAVATMAAIEQQAGNGAVTGTMSAANESFNGHHHQMAGN